jgi:hypothetical protein
MTLGDCEERRSIDAITIPLDVVGVLTFATLNSA